MDFLIFFFLYVSLFEKYTGYLLGEYDKFWKIIRPPDKPLDYNYI